MEKRFDVRIPVANTTLLECLMKEREKTGISEARLLVLYASKYVEISQGVLPPVVPSPPQPSPKEFEPPQPTLNETALDDLFGPPD